MSKTVWKYPLAITDEQEISMPIGARILSVDFQDSRLFLWAVVDPDEQEQEQVTLRVVGTGHQMADYDEERWRFIGTVYHRLVTLVFHLWVVSK